MGLLTTCFCITGDYGVRTGVYGVHTGCLRVGKKQVLGTITGLHGKVLVFVGKHTVFGRGYFGLRLTTCFS